VPLFAPYGGGLDLVVLDQALALLQQGRFSGERRLQGGDARPFELLWSGGQAPLELASCTLRFPQLPQVHYSFQLPAHRLLAWLASLQGDASGQDLPDGFWSWFILGVGDGQAA